MNRKKILLIAISGIAVAVAVAFLLLSGPRMKNQPNLRAFETEVNLPPEGSVFYTPGNFGKKSENEITTSSTNLEKGAVYYGYYCVFCHGKNGKGNGPVGESYIPKPADLTNPTIRQLDTESLLNRSFNGIGHEPALDRIVPQNFRKDIILFIKDGL